VELEGIARAVAVREVSPLLLIVCDRSQPLTDDDRRVLDETAGRPRVIAANKSDLPAAWDAPIPDAPTVAVSARTGADLDTLKAAMVSALIDGREPARDVPAVTNIRHADLIVRAKAALERASDAARSGTPEEFVLADVNDARACLEEVTGARTADDLLHAIFDKFCIGK
jgi:tRNA modification GTPase